MTVSDLDRSLDFYNRLLGMKPHVRWQGGAYLSLDNIWFCLSLGEVKPSQDYSHIAFDVAEEDMQAVAMKLCSEKVAEWKENKSEGPSLYLLDPDGHKLEIHGGNLESRLESLKSHPYEGLVWL